MPPNRFGTPRCASRSGAVLHPVVGELTRVISPIPRQYLSRVQVLFESGTKILDNASHGVWVLSAESVQVIVHVLALPPQHHPFSEFLTLPTVSSHLNFVVLFRTTSTHRILGLQSFPLSASRSTFRRSLLSCCWTSAA